MGKVDVLIEILSFRRIEFTGKGEIIIEIFSFRRIDRCRSS